MHTCQASPTPVGPVNLTICPSCHAYSWTNKHGLGLDPAEGMAAAYGGFDLVNALASIGAPGGIALVYRVPRRLRNRLDALTMGVWTEIHPDLFATHDGTSLLLAPADATLSATLLALG